MRDLRPDELGHVYGGNLPRGTDKKTDKKVSDKKTDKRTDKKKST